LLKSFEQPHSGQRADGKTFGLSYCLKLIHLPRLNAALDDSIFRQAFTCLARRIFSTRLLRRSCLCFGVSLLGIVELLQIMLARIHRMKNLFVIADKFDSYLKRATVPGETYEHQSVVPFATNS